MIITEERTLTLNDKIFYIKLTYENNIIETKIIQEEIVETIEEQEFIRYEDKQITEERLITNDEIQGIADNFVLNILTAEERNIADYFEYNHVENIVSIIAKNKLQSELNQAKQEKLKLLQANYIKSQVVILKDSIEIMIPLQGEFYKMLKDRENVAFQHFYATVILQGLDGSKLYVCKKEYNTNGEVIKTGLPYVFISEVVHIVNEDYSEANKSTLDKISSQIDVSRTIEELNLININNVFILCPVVDLDVLIDETLASSDLDLQNEAYNQRHINNFREWAGQLTKNENNRYNIFTKL